MKTPTLWPIAGRSRASVWMAAPLLAMLAGCSSSTTVAPEDSGSDSATLTPQPDGGDAGEGDGSTISDAADGGNPGLSDAEAGPVCSNDPTCTHAGQLCTSTEDLETCTLGSNGCLTVSTAAAPCPTHEACSTESDGGAACVCSNDTTCTHAGQLCTTAGDLETCTADSNGCLFVSTAAAPCGTHQTCDAENDGGAACTCTPTTCTAAGPACTSGSDIDTCSMDTNGCLFVSTAAAACASNGLCSGAAGAAACCNNDPTCTQTGPVCTSGGDLETCSVASNGCLVVSTAAAPCATHEVCSGAAGSASCICNNDPTCSTSGPTCTAGGLETCGKDANSCLFVSTPAAACPVHEVCTGAGGAASCTCKNDPTCTAAGPICTSPSDIETCSADPNSCLFVSTAAAACTTSVANATPDCASNACGQTCDTTFHACGSAPEQCLSNTSTQSCGTSCTPCSPPTNATPTCTGAPLACGFTCVNGFHECGGNACDDNTSVSSCGASCTACTPPANSTASCNGTACGFTCTAPYVLNTPADTACSPPASRPIGPLTGNMVSVRNPTLSWMLPAGFTGAQVDVCADRACSNVLWTSATVTGTSTASSRVVVAQTLPTALTFWRVYTMNGGQRGTISSPVWEFQAAGTHSAPLFTSWPNFADIEGDGYADLIVDSNVAGPLAVQELPGSKTGIVAQARSSWTTSETLVAGGDINGDGYSDVVVLGPSTVYVLLGSPTGFPTTPSYTTAAPSGTAYATTAGDVNGDGYADLVTTSSTVAGTWYLTTLYGSATGFPAVAPAGVVIPTTVTSNEVVPAAIGDVNDDGYADLAIRDSGASGANGRVWIYLGSATGPGATPATTLSPPLGAADFGGTGAVFGPATGGTVTSDVNGDGYLDLFVVSYDSSGNNPSIQVYLGSATGFPALPSATLSAPYNESQYAGGGDVNGDGYGDLILAGGVAAGETDIFEGSTNGLPATPSQVLQATSIPDITASSNTDILDVSLLGDVNGDGFADFAVSARCNALLPGSVVAVYQGSGAMPQAPALEFSVANSSSSFW